MDCLFCKIIDGQIKSDIVYQDELILAFRDINPQAPHHILIIPKKHIATINDIQDEDQLLMGHMMLMAKKIAADLNVAEDGYRLLFNINGHGGQEVYHIHLHLLAGRRLQWPPG